MGLRVRRIVKGLDLVRRELALSADRSPWIGRIGPNKLS